jgi:hypothetical protein
MAGAAPATNLAARRTRAETVVLLVDLEAACASVVSI